MSEYPLEELERLKAEVDEVKYLPVGSAAWQGVASQATWFVVHHAEALLSAAREAETLRKLDEWKSASTERDVWIGRVQRETTCEVELAEGKERNVIRMHERLADAISAALNEWDSTDA